MGYKRPPVGFIAHSYRQAGFWAHEWGFTKQEWFYIPIDNWFEKLCAWYEPDGVFFWCGTVFPSAAMELELMNRKIELHNAEDIYNIRRENERLMSM